MSLQLDLAQTLFKVRISSRLPSGVLPQRSAEGLHAPKTLISASKLLH